MGSAISRAMRWVVQRRDRLPLLGPFVRSAERNPRGLPSKIVYRVLGSDRSRPVSTPSPSGSTRVLVGPTNYAGQGDLWARSMTAHLPDVGARSLGVAVPGAITFPSDTTVPLTVYRHSRRWQDAEYAAVVEGFTHVLIESMRPMFGLRFEDAVAEIDALRSRGISVALIAHGTDVRSASRHAAAHAWSPFGEVSADATAERAAERNRRVAESLGLPVFVSTPDLLDDLPGATWCPVVVDPQRWRTTEGPLSTDAVPVVVHAASSPRVKGTDLIEPALWRLHEQGTIVYRPLVGVPSAQMPQELRRADIVLDQFRLGSYGVAACEAMAAGRIVVGHVSDAVRARVREATSSPLPMIESSPESIAEVLVGILESPSEARRVAKEGTRFVHQVHTGKTSADALRNDWLALPRAA